MSKAIPTGCAFASCGKPAIGACDCTWAQIQHWPAEEIKTLITSWPTASIRTLVRDAAESTDEKLEHSLTLFGLEQILEKPSTADTMRADIAAIIETAVQARADRAISTTPTAPE